MVLGITGLSGSGKHVAADFLAQKGWILFDADKIAHYLYRPYTYVWKALVSHFGESILTQNDLIDRQKLSRFVFNEKDPEGSKKALDDLNAIVHPAIRRYLEDQIHYQRRREKNVAIVAALWQELGLPEFCEKILLIKTDPPLGQERIQHRDSISAEMVNLRVQNQTEPPNPDFVIENNGSVKELYGELAKLVNSWS